MSMSRLAVIHNKKGNWTKLKTLSVIVTVRAYESGVEAREPGYSDGNDQSCIPLPSAQAVEEGQRSWARSVALEAASTYTEKRIQTYWRSWRVCCPHMGRRSVSREPSRIISSHWIRECRSLGTIIPNTADDAETRTEIRSAEASFRGKETRESIWDFIRKGILVPPRSKVLS